ncbi:MAG: PTS sugar transporter subunit IIA [Pirellulales bacterium]
MAEPDFDIDGLAAYLHLMPRQVERLVTRGQLPGRKVGGQWRFSRADIHHWMEARMGVLDDAELVQVETALQRTDSTVVVRDLMHAEAIRLPLQSRSRTSVITEMCELAAQTGLLWDADAMAEAVTAREDLQSTAMDNGVALLHPRRPLTSILAEPLIAVGISSQGLPFGGSRTLTDVFFLICSTDDRGHLRTLARLSRILSVPDFLTRLRACTDAPEILELIDTTETQLDTSRG